MIHVFGALDPPVPRLVAVLGARGHQFSDQTTPEPDTGATLLLSTPVDWMRLGVNFSPWLVAPGVRILVVSRMGAHPDAVAPGLQALWRLEEYARVSLIPTLALRLAPLAGPATPFWRKLAARPRLGAAAGAVVMPVLESDAVEVLHAALVAKHRWEGWFDVVGPEARTLAEWSEVAGHERGADDVPWEPPLEEMMEHRLAEPELWQKAYGLVAHDVAAAPRGTR